MAPATASQLARFCYAVVRVVPDPIKDEAVNVGVVVTPAESLDQAVERLFTRYVTWRLPRRRGRARLTHAALRDHIWQIVSRWESPTLRAEQGGVLTGHRATHRADIVLSNGHPRAALFAVPTYRSDEDLPYLYRDRIPTIAQDMPPGFYTYAVLPALSDQATESERQFADETRRLLSGQPRVSTVQVDSLDTLRPEVERLLVDADFACDVALHSSTRAGPRMEPVERGR